MAGFNIRETLEAFLHPIDLDEDMQYVRDGLGREIELDADPVVSSRKRVLLQQHFLSDPSFLGSEALLFMDRSYVGTPMLTSDEVDALESIDDAKSWNHRMNLIGRVTWETLELQSFFRLTSKEEDRKTLVDLSTVWWSPRYGSLFRTFYWDLRCLRLPSIDLKAKTLRTLVLQRVIEAAIEELREHYLPAVQVGFGRGDN